ncbi:DUF3048 domain-containing protein [Arenivirga flava]|uniref:DUF3048 domain-containing protein n=1 Tax=Arenivirga flava TaxID=1930060 RepID=A0AA37UHK7_9MICO|nr:DUF3048 domain-containing protein [Arenivirga flava]GMA29395.1 hypothetical protein GCM10025874_26480 [Arenivirga flava]
MTTTARRRPTTAILTAVLALGLVAACSEQPEQPVPTATPAPEPPAPVLAPLRGTVVDGELGHPALAAKIDNHAAARPQIGLERADLVFEELVEGGLTRYVAVWHSDVPEEVGPVRSIRPMDPDIVSPFEGLIAYSGGQPQFVRMMEEAPVVNVVHGAPGTEGLFSRTADKAAPHNVILRASDLVGRHADLAAPAMQFSYAADGAPATASEGGDPTGRLDLVFSHASGPSWSWDPAASVFLRAQGGEVDTDAAGAQLAAVNVVTLRVPVTAGEVPKTELIGEGEALVSTGGGTVSATWVKRSPTDRIRLVDALGVDVRLAAGNTWIELVPTTGSAAVVAP